MTVELALGRTRGSARRGGGDAAFTPGPDAAIIHP
jgi:hypothetical protein